MIGRHLQKLPVKSFEVAPGDVIGGLVYVMDKPLGIEEGMVGISIDSPGYREFIKKQLALLETVRLDKTQNKLTSPELQKRYEKIYRNRANNFQTLNENEKIDLLMKDKVHEKKRHGASWKEFKNVFFSFGKYHEMKGWQSYYVNRGAGGLLFDAYKKECGIQKKDHFATHINKLIRQDNNAYMIKQDGEMVLGGTGPGLQKILKTTTGKRLQALVNPFVIVLTGGLSALIFGVAVGFWRRHYIKNNTPISVNSDAIVESLSTKLAQIRGFKSQDIDTVEGTYENGAPKIVTAVTWKPGCRDLSDKLAGGKDNYNSVIIAWDKHDVPYKVATIDGTEYTIRSTGKDKKGNIIGYEKVDAQGKITPATLEQYQSGQSVSNDAIGGLGESLLSFIAMADRDGIGKIGQNKAIVALNPPQGNVTHQFFGIDFGKSYKGPNPIVNSLRDDFSFDNPNGIRERFVNYSALYDNPLREKMKGVYLLAALRNQLSDVEKEAIAAEYQAGNDKAFADKLRGYPASVGGVNSDINLIEAQKLKYVDLASDPRNIDKKDEYLQYAERLDDISKISKNTDAAILKTFAKRMHLTPSQIDLLDNIEKLSANNAHTLSVDGKVKLNHIRVEPTDRIAWQLQKNVDGTFTLACENNQDLATLKQRFKTVKEDNIATLLNKVVVVDGKPCIPNLTEGELNTLCKELTESKVANARDLDFRSVEKRNQFHASLHQADHPQPKVSAPIDIPKPRFVEAEPVARMAPMRPISHQFMLNAPISNKNLDTLFVQRGTFQKIEEYLDNDEHREQHQIASPVKHATIGNLNPEKGLGITFKEPRTKNDVQTYIQQNQNDEVRFTIEKDCSERDFKFAIGEMCRLAIQNAEPKTTFDLTLAPADKKEMIMEAFEDALSEELSKPNPRFDQHSAPRLVDVGSRGPDHDIRAPSNI